MSQTFEHPEGRVEIHEVAKGRWRVCVRAARPDLYIPVRECETGDPPELIEAILRLRGAAYLCDELRREEAPGSLRRNLEHDLLGYVDAAEFRGRRLLDFGCGAGASTMILARLLPETAITGVELNPAAADVAAARARHHGLEGRVRFLVSPSPETLPEGLEPFDFVLLCAVFEHLLPAERRTLAPLLWRALRPGGVLFLNQTPNRWFPVETHTTGGLPLLNYLPARLARPYALAASRRDLRGDSWTALLRRGIRGGSAREVLRLLRAAPESRNGAGAARPVLLRPILPGARDAVDLWFLSVPPESRSAARRAFYRAAKALRALTGAVFVPTLALAIRKSA